MVYWQAHDSIPAILGVPCPPRSQPSLSGGAKWKNLPTKFPNWSLPGYHGKRAKTSGFMVLCALFLHTTLSIFNVLREYVFWVTFVPVFDQSEVQPGYQGQPDWNDNHFQKVSRHGLSWWYIIHGGWHLGRCSNVMSKFGLLTTVPPP